MIGNRGGAAHSPNLSGAESAVWAMIATLVSGPAVWGGIGYLLDRVTGASVFTPIGVAVGFVTAIYIVYVRYGRDDPAHDRGDVRQ
jgi:F0F1-type ATP synthase assembly protein I